MLNRIKSFNKTSNNLALGGSKCFYCNSVGDFDCWKLANSSRFAFDCDLEDDGGSGRPGCVTLSDENGKQKWKDRKSSKIIFNSWNRNHIGTAIVRGCTAWLKEEEYDICNHLSYCITCTGDYCNSKSFESGKAISSAEQISMKNSILMLLLIMFGFWKNQM